MEFRNAHTLDGVERTQDIKIQENITFDEMYLSDAVLAGLHSCRFVKPSPIQLSAIPLGRCGLDLIVQAKSGTGKTCVFSVIALEMISVVTKATQVLVIAPTREIAVQIGQVINSIGSTIAELKTATFIGGTSVQDDKAKLKCCHIAIGTPGRLNQLVSLGSLDLSNVRLLVLDEADELLTGQFKSCIIELVKTLPFNKQILALSATYPPEVTEYLDNFMRSPTHVRLGKEAPALVGVLQFVRLLPDHPQSHQRHKMKFSELLSILSTVSFNQCLVFSNSQLRAESICNQLKSSGWPASFLTGGQIQKERLEAFFALCSYKCRILVSTDLSARGLDSEHVNLVINLDIPMDQATYLHRVGRAGRFGSKGFAVSLVCEGEEWETMRAVATLTNVQVRILYEDYVSSTFEVKEDLEMVECLDSESLSQWLEKQDKKKIKYRAKSETKASNSKQAKKKSGSLVACQEMIQTKELPPNQVQIENEAVKDILHNFTNNHDIYTFKHANILDQIKKKWETHSKCDNPKIIRSNYLKNYPSTEQMKILDTFVMGLEAKANERERCMMQEKHKDFNSIINDLQCVIQGEPVQGSENDLNPVTEFILVQGSENDLNPVTEFIPVQGSENDLNPVTEFIPVQGSENDLNPVTEFIPVQGSENDLNPVTEFSEKIPKYNGTDREILSEPQNCPVLNDNGNASLITPAPTLELKAICNPTNNSNIKKNENIKDKEHQNAVRKKKYAENTGFGEWVPVSKENFLPERNLNSKESTLSAKKKTRKPISNHQYDDSYYYEEINDLSDIQDPSNRNLYSSELDTNYHASINSYINSATKFAEMMEYVKCVGRMSALVAHQSHYHLCK